MRGWPGNLIRGEPRNVMRQRAGSKRVTNVELFFDLVYVFAVTQLSHYLLNHPSPEGALRTGLLLRLP
jgi:low temperature requirement protein LtrA